MTASKKLEPPWRKKAKGRLGLPINGRKTQPICAPTRLKTIIQIRNTTRTCWPSMRLSTRSMADGSGGSVDGGIGGGGGAVFESGRQYFAGAKNASCGLAVLTSVTHLSETNHP